MNRNSRCASTRSRAFASVEAAAVFVCIVIYIWYLQDLWPGAMLAVLAGIVLSDALRRHSLHRIGLSIRRFRRNVRRFGWPLVLSGAFLILATALLGHARGIEILAGYCVWGLIQQYVLNGFFVKRFLMGGVRGVPVLAGGVFAALHYPNPFLMCVTLCGGVIAALFYVRFRDLLLLGIAHGLIGTALFVAVPEQITHDFDVGPAYVVQVQAAMRSAR